MTLLFVQSLIFIELTVVSYEKEKCHFFAKVHTQNDL